MVDGLLQFGSLSEDEQKVIGHSLEARGRSLQDTLVEASSLLAGRSDAAGLVVAPKGEGGIKHIEFVALGSNRALVILMGSDGHVENRVIETPVGMPPSALVEAANYLNARAMGASLPDLRSRVSAEMKEARPALHGLSAGAV